MRVSAKDATTYASKLAHRSWMKGIGSARFMPGHRWAHLAGPEAMAMMGVVPDLRYPEKYNMVASKDHDGYWVEPKSGTVVDVLNNKIVAPAALVGKAFWPQLKARPPTPEEKEFFSRGPVDMAVGFVKQLPGSVAEDAKSAVRTVTSSAASIPQKIETTVRALVPPAAAYAAAVVAPFGVAGKLAAGAGAFVLSRLAEKKV